LLFAGSIITALIAVRAFSQSLYPPILHAKDFVQEWLLAKAITCGEDPYQPTPDLQARYLPEAPPTHFLHPTPHPPFLALLCLPLAFFSYHVAATFWLALGIALLLLSAFLIRRIVAPRASIASVCGIALLALLAGPVTEELWLGQVNLLLLP